MRKYYFTKDGAFVEISEAEFLEVMGDEVFRPYATKILREKITIEDVPEEYREAVATIVSKRIEKRDNLKISPAELASMLQEVM